MTTPQPAPRLLSGLAGALLLLLAAVCTLGTSLAAPIGSFIAQRITRRKGRPLTWGTSWLAAVFASSVAVAIGFALVVVSAPPGAILRAERAAASPSAVEPTARPPEWLTHLFPQAAQRPGPITERVIHSRAFMLYAGLLGAASASAFFGAIAGSLGWGAARLLGYAFSGRFAP